MNLRGWLTAVAMLLGLGLVGGAIMYLGDPDDGATPDTCGSAFTNDEGFVETDYVSSPRLHTDAEVDYCETPPMGGYHADEWLQCGVYDQPVREENAVHELEHGAVWITYDPSLSADELAQLQDRLPEHVILSPYDDLPTSVVATAWNRQVQVAGPADPKLQEFLDEYSDGHTAAEKELVCQGGIEAYED